MRLRAKVDGNHHAIVVALRAAGRRVLDLSRVGHGCPDILVSWGGGGNLLMEIKVPGKWKLTPDQTVFHNNWPGPKCVVTSVEQALRETGAGSRIEP